MRVVSIHRVISKNADAPSQAYTLVTGELCNETADYLVAFRSEFVVSQVRYLSESPSDLQRERIPSSKPRANRNLGRVVADPFPDDHRAHAGLTPMSLNFII